MTDAVEGKRRYMTPKEYLDAQRARGGCAEDFKQTLIKSSKLGTGIGVPFGLYVSYKSGHRTIKSFAAKTFFTTLSSNVFFGAIGLMIGTYNCFKLDKEGR